MTFLISLKTEKQALQKLFSIPLIGKIAILLLAILPFAVYLIMDIIFRFQETGLFSAYVFLGCALWNLLLTFTLKIRISIFFIPCWIIFAVVGALFYLGILR